MTMTVDEAGALIGEPPLDPKSPLQQIRADFAAVHGEMVWVSAEQESRVVGTRAAALLPGLAERLAPIDKWVARGQQISGEWTNLRAAAAERLAQAQTTLVDDPTGAQELVNAQKALDAVEESRKAFEASARQARQRGYAIYTGLRDQIFTGCQVEARKVVDQVAAVLPLPSTVWGAAEPERAMLDAGRLDVWGVLVGATVRFQALVELANLLRPAVGASADMITSAAPRSALVFRNWPVAGDFEPQQHYRRLKPVLRLAYAVEKGWEPGIWRPSDVDAGKRKASWGERVMARVGEVIGTGQPAGVTPKVPQVIPAAEPPPAQEDLGKLGIG